MNTQPKILIIDDQLSARSGLKALLDNEAYELFFAENGMEGNILLSFEMIRLPRSNYFFPPNRTWH